jgi:hypothetical protein
MEVREDALEAVAELVDGSTPGAARAALCGEDGALSMKLKRRNKPRNYYFSYSNGSRFTTCVLGIPSINIPRLNFHMV